MKPLLRSILAPIAVLAVAGVLAWLFLQQQARHEAAQIRGQTSVQKNFLELRIGAIGAAERAHQVSLEAERLTFEQEKRDADVAELADLSHEVRMLRIDLEFKTALAAIDKKYPPPNRAVERPPAP